ncbi:hypothetical protein SSX86_032539 [Deinandra increscens subsp. villosa]|uniref:Uncharacterized protein n=1 Tax=Deinandra increscens subsp. villosa TaxID=3103831 RepID=A0AAP0GHP1_9ASTR
MSTRTLEILKAVAVRGGGAVSRSVEEGGVVRMKILIKRQELEQVIKKSGENDKENRVKRYNHRQLSRSLASKSLKAPVIDDRVKVKRVSFDQVNVDCRSHWRPELQSIPEEF